MIPESRRAPARVLGLLAALILLASASPGCGDGSTKGGADAGVAPVVKESNDNMQNFMKSQQKKR